jgi:Esterase/lipase
MAVVGDSAGGNLAAAVTLPAKERGDVRFAHQVLPCPVTDAGCDRRSYARFASGRHLHRDTMRWCLEQFARDTRTRMLGTVSALCAPLDQLAGLPPGLVITAEADVVRDEGEAYAARLRAAGVPVTAVRCLGVIHDFAVLDALRGSQAAGGASSLACDTLHSVLHDALPAALPL